MLGTQPHTLWKTLRCLCWHQKALQKALKSVPMAAGMQTDATGPRAEQGGASTRRKPPARWKPGLPFQVCAEEGEHRGRPGEAGQPRSTAAPEHIYIPSTHSKGQNGAMRSFQRGKSHIGAGKQWDAGQQLDFGEGDYKLLARGSAPGALVPRFAQGLLSTSTAEPRFPQGQKCCKLPGAGF